MGETWFISTGTSSRAKKHIAAVVVVITIYVMWNERNLRVFSNQSKTTTQLIHKINLSLYVRIGACQSKKLKACFYNLTKI